MLMVTLVGWVAGTVQEHASDAPLLGFGDDENQDDESYSVTR